MNNPHYHLNDRVAFVTGAASGIGRAIAERLAREGAHVILSDLDGERVLAVASDLARQWGHTEPMELDVAQDGAIERTIQQVMDLHGRVDILVNNVGILNAESAQNTSLAAWERVIRINMTSAFVCCKAVYPAMAQQNYGKIINIGSIAGRSTSTTGGVAYTASKSGLMGMSRHLAREWARVGIRVNAICPGMVDTPMTRNTVDEAMLERILATIPVGRLALPEEIAALAAFLASSESDYITGTSMDINGGELIIA